MANKEGTAKRGRRGEELKAYVTSAHSMLQSRVIQFDVEVAGRSLLVVRDAEGNYRHALTTEFNRCGDRTRRLSIQVAIAEAEAHYDEKRFIFGKEDTYGALNLTRPVKRYVVVMQNGTDPQLSAPFDTEEKQDAEARRILRENVEDVIMWMVVNGAGEAEMEAYSSGFFEQQADEESEAAA